MPIIVADYDPAWVERYESERAVLAEALAPNVVTIEHIGSTSVPGLAAKPIVDIAVVLRTYTLLADVRPRLRRLDYRYGGEGGVPLRTFFAKPPLSKTANGDRLFNLHVTGLGCSDFVAHTLFRDHLRRYPEVRDAYAALKRQVAASVEDDVMAYINGKEAFILGELAKARAESGR